MIPLTALSAILVYTGYKLADPTNIGKIFKIGNEQLLIFSTTLLVTIFTNLMIGIERHSHNKGLVEFDSKKQPHRRKAHNQRTSQESTNNLHLYK